MTAEEKQQIIHLVDKLTDDHVSRVDVADGRFYMRALGMFIKIALIDHLYLEKPDASSPHTTQEESHVVVC